MIQAMICYQAILQYDGSNHQGFQFQEGARTIQGDLNQSLERILTAPFTTRAASRTDKGVHAIAQVVKISSEDPTPLTHAHFEKVLPPHIRCLDLTVCPREFIPSMDQVSKEYRYLFSASSERFIAKAPEHLNLEAMKECAAMLTGVHDFKNFWSIGGISNSTVRNILLCEISTMNPKEFFKDTLFTTQLTNCYQFRIVASGFLKHMVRHLMGALFQVGLNELKIEDFTRYLQGEQKSQRPWKKADPKGLYLLKVSYKA
jgi:tRNA pseudouridine38-40 synthase